MIFKSWLLWLIWNNFWQWQNFIEICSKMSFCLWYCKPFFPLDSLFDSKMPSQFFSRHTLSVHHFKWSQKWLRVIQKILFLERKQKILMNWHYSLAFLRFWKTRPNTWHKMHLAVIWEKALWTDGPTDGRTDTSSCGDAMAHLKTPYGQTDGATAGQTLF